MIGAPVETILTDVIAPFLLLRIEQAKIGAKSSYQTPQALHQNART